MSSLNCSICTSNSYKVYRVKHISHLFRTLDPNNNSNTNQSEKLMTEWKCPAKETRSSRQRREMNAGKGVSF